MGLLGDLFDVVVERADEYKDELWEKLKKKSKQMETWREEAEKMNNRQLVSALNCSRGSRRAIYMGVAKSRGGIGFGDGLFYVYDEEE